MSVERQTLEKSLYKAEALKRKITFTTGMPPSRRRLDQQELRMLTNALFLLNWQGNFRAQKGRQTCNLNKSGFRIRPLLSTT